MILPQNIVLLSLLAVLPISFQSQLPRRFDLTRSLSITTSSTTRAQLLQRHTTEDTQPTTISAPVPTNPHTTVAIPSSTTTIPAIPTKSGVKGCHVEGIPKDLLNSYIWGGTKAYDPLGCQLDCLYISQCEAYSFQTPENGNNCVFYHMFIDSREALTPSKTSGIFFSDKYPGDGSNFCYGSNQL